MNLNYDTCSREELIEAHKSLSLIIEQLAQELAQLKRALYGVKSERFIPAAPPDQLRLSFEREGESVQATEQPVDTQVIERKVPKKGKHPVRQELPAHLPRKIIELTPVGYEEGMKCIGTEVTEVLDYLPQRHHLL